ncbi:MAG: hypothetical protein E7632_02625 [Ruminococcaceae bacterium]|nr:hypothetical protein [Oscillospiraceae bacterium]
MSKKIVTFLLLASMLTALSCGESASGQTDTSADTETTTAPETAEYTAPEVNYDGAEFFIMDQDSTSNTNWLCLQYHTISAEEENGEPINDAQYRSLRKAEEDLNIKINCVMPGSRLKTLRNTVMAQDDEYDIVTTTSAGTLASEAGLVTDLAAIDSLDLSASWWQQNAIESFTLNGKLKVLIGDITPYTYFSPIIFYFNKQVVDEFKLENPYDLVRSGDWTLAKVYEMSRAVAYDLNGDNKMDVEDRFGTAEQSVLVSDLLLASGERYAVQNSDGDVELVLNNERAASVISDAVKFLRDDEVNNRADRFTGKYTNVYSHLHVPMFKNNQLLFNFQQLLVTFELRSMEADFGVLPVPKYDKEQKEYYTPMSTTWAEFVAVPTTNQELELAGHVLNALGYYGQQYIKPAFIDTTVVAKSLRDEDSVEMLELIMNSIVYDIGIYFDWGGLASKVNALGSGNKPDGFASMYAGAESAAKEAMNKTLELLAEE